VRTSLMEEVALGRATELLDELTPHSGTRLWRNGRVRNDWLFRGQSDARWGLVPAAFRSNLLARLWPGIDPLSIPAGTRRRVEHDLVLRFSAEADAAGHPLFGDSPSLRRLQLTDRSLMAADFPPEQFWGLYATAQHYGVPTRFLDWTTRPLIAAYFSCVDVAQWLAPSERRVDQSPTELPDRFAVWALSQQLVCHLAPREVAIVTAAASAIPNLYLQQARFTIARAPEVTSSVPEKPVALTEVVQRLRERDAPEWMSPALIQFTLPVSQAPELLALLHRSHVYRATVFSSLDAVFRSMVEATWQKESAVDDDPLEE
jgi:hypothetical protein